MNAEKRNAQFGIRFSTVLATCMVLIAAFSATSVWAASKARIVRLSEVQGTVQIDRGAGDGFSKAFINLPVVEGSSVKTGNDGKAEVEFEDGSTLRLAPGTDVNFARLSLGDDGNKLDTVQLRSGTVYANVHPKNSRDKAADQFVLNFARESVTVPGSAHFRLAIDGSSKATLAVFKGKCTATLPSEQFEVAEKHGATIKFASDPTPTNAATKEESAKSESDKDKDLKDAKDTIAIAKHYDSDPADAWDREQNEYHDRFVSTSASSRVSSPYAYGMSDLNYYGNFMNVPGYGNVWQPYLTGANWSPFQDGGWAFYPGAGYMWISGYPWGWMPYRYGNWVMAPGFGWVWQPGNWNSYYAVPRVVNAPVTTKLPVPPSSGNKTVMVGRGLATNPAAGTVRVLTITPGSAGFGVPRGSVDHLNNVAKKVDHTSRPVVVSTAPPVSNPPMSSLPSRGGFGSMPPSASAGRGMGPAAGGAMSRSPGMGGAPRTSAGGGTRPH
jgi:hypothetical protein